MLKNRLSPSIRLLIIIIFGILLRVIFFSGYQVGDDKHYLLQAYKFSTGNFAPGENLWSLRIGLVGPTALFFFLFGINEFSAVLFSLLCSIGSIILIYYFGKLLFDKNTGVMSAFLLSFFPLDVIFATHLYPDIPLEFFLSLGVFFFLKGEKTDKKIYYLLSGIFIGIAYLQRITALLIVFFFIFYILYKKRFKINHLIVAMVVLVIFIFESCIYYFQTGNFFYQYLTIISHGINIGYPLTRGTNWIIEPLFILTTEQELGFFYYFIFPVTVYLIFKRDKNIIIPLLWIIPLFLYIFYGPVDLCEYRVLLRDARYLSVITIPGLLILSYYLVRILHKKIISIYIVIFLLLTSIGCVIIDNSRITDYIPKQIYTFYKNHPNTDLILRPFDYFSILFYSRFQTNPHLKLFYLEGYMGGDTVKDIRSVYPNVKGVYDLSKVHNAYVGLDVKYINYIPSNSKLIKTIKKPQRFYYSILQKGILKKIFQKLMGQKEYPFHETVQIYYLY